MNCLLEVLGLALPYNGSALALSAEREALAQQSRRTNPEVWLRST